MITTAQNTALLAIGNAALKNAAWADYAHYCFDREKGLRKEAFRHLDNFLKSTTTWTLPRKIDFVKFLFSLFEAVEEADHGPFPQPLSDHLVKPVLTAWCDTEPTDSRPFRWFGKYYRSEAHLLKALAINPADDLARQTLLNGWAYRIYYSVHHLPEGYLGDPAEDIQLGNSIAEQIRHLTASASQAYWTNKLEPDLELVRNYLDWKTSGHPNFAQWGQENHRRTSYGRARTYSYEK